MPLGAWFEALRLAGFFLSLSILRRQSTATSAAIARAVIADTQAIIIQSVWAEGRLPVPAGVDCTADPNPVSSKEHTQINS